MKISYLIRIQRREGYRYEEIYKQRVDHLDIGALSELLNRPHVANRPRRPRGWKPSLDKKSQLAPKS